MPLIEHGDPFPDSDHLHKSCSVPTSEIPGPAKEKRKIIHPPSVATSKAFVEFVEAKELEKKAVQEAKELKRKEREQKRAVKQTEPMGKRQEKDKKRKIADSLTKASKAKKKRNYVSKPFYY